MKTDKEEIRISKFLSLVLRHKPETIGLHLDDNGWANTQELMERLNSNDFEISIEDLKQVVANNDKKRFQFSEDYSKIRASQGHSLKVDLALEEKIPPRLLYHGTAEKNLDSIRKQGLVKGQRHHVHLSADKETAQKVGMRHGKPLVLKVRSEEMSKAGIRFYQSENGVWLTDTVPPDYLEE
jgi:putative RNA 2'-phosphotransferase